MKRPRAPIACFRCHRKKVRCDGAHPFCTRCQSTGSSCSYPSSRRSRNTQPHHVDPYIDHLSQLEHQIRQIEVDMNEYRSMLLSSLMTTTMDPTLGNTSTTASAAPNGQHQPHPQEDMLRSHLSKTEQEVQESRTILAQLRLRGEQRIARTKRNQTKEAKQQQQRQQQQHQRSSSSASVSPNNDKKKTTTSSSSRTAPATTTKGRKSESTASTNEVVSSSSSSYLGSSIHYESSSATKSANHKPGMKTSSSSTLQHVPTNFLPMDLYGQPPPASPSTSYQNMYHTHHHHQHTSSGGYPMPPPPPPPQQQQPADLYYMTMVGATSTGATGSMNAAAYYDPLMDYPWTTPTDFAAASTTTTTTTSGLHDSKPVATTSSATNTPTATSSMENEIKTETVQHQESAHYSPSTVAAIEQVTRMAQQMNHPHQQ